MTATAQDLVRIAKGQLGYVEKGGKDGKSGNVTKYGADFGLNGAPWCSIFVWWCFKAIGLDLKHLITANYASAELAMEGWQKQGLKIYKSPKLGDVVFFHFSGEHAGANHTGIVVGADANGVHTIEGNTSSGDKGSQVNGGGVYARYRPYSICIGFGRFKWATPAPAAPKSTPVQGKKYPTLKAGMKGAEVKRLQFLLHIPQDGDFGPTTEKHVKQAQFNRQLVQDGIAGPALLSKLGY